MKEFDFIEKYLQPLTNNFAGALNLADDVAIIPKNATHDYVISKDGIVEGVHFLPSATPEQIAEKLLRVNLSDIAAKGAKPLFYLSFGGLNKKTNVAWLKKFTGALQKVQEEFGLILIGGDTVKGDIKGSGKLFFSVTIIAEVKKGKALLRKNAKAGDDIYVSGNIGEAEIGLRILKGVLPDNTKDNLKIKNSKHYINRHYKPSPRVELGQNLMGVANACTDCSDGVFASVNNICNASNKVAQIYLDKIPVPTEFKNMAQELAASGDDYELVFTASPKMARKIAAISQKTGVKITKIGVIKKLDNTPNKTANKNSKLSNDKFKNLTIIGFDNKIIKLNKIGFEHE
jgi:thiamine-monophosphate kinase